MLLVSLFALALAGADAKPAANTADAPALPTAKAEPFTPAPEEPWPVGAPRDDYGFVSWCYGALAGHMHLYEMVKPELDKQSTNPKEDAQLDAEQMKAGTEYLALYKKAMEAAEKASPQPINARGAQAVRAGAAIWGPAEEADPKTRMWSYLSWDLPGRCESTAEKLYQTSLVSAEALGIDLDTPSAAGKASAVPTTSAAPKPASAPAKPKAGADLRGAQ
ncbi:MAG TPA: hypothetical protein VMU59_05225 [Caulobacteraceae bacterium]|nr:hypothetical protein [Caulobacteraceae bacterium]